MTLVVSVLHRMALCSVLTCEWSAERGRQEDETSAIKTDKLFKLFSKCSIKTLSLLLFM